jgi:N-acetylglucosaminyl-diphospho-decaprenol L-rhamnosyltransferase
MSESRPVLVSIVSHGHGRHVAALLEDLALPGNCEDIRVVLRLNKPETKDGLQRHWPFPLEIVCNDQERGFSANHNATFRQFAGTVEGSFFCVLNPDIRLQAGTMAAMLDCCKISPGAALMAPEVCAPDGRVEASARQLPTPGEIFRKGLMRLLGQGLKEELSGAMDWFAGMFMLFEAAAFRAVGGFDERYFLYYEDVDICCRLRLEGLGLRFCPTVTVVHDAQRGSHRNVGLFLRHISSVIRFFSSPVYRQCRRLARMQAG